MDTFRKALAGSFRLRLPQGGGRHYRPSSLSEEAISVQAISWVIEHSKHKGNSFVVLMMIANHARSDGTGAWPSIQTLCKESRLSRRTVQRCIRRLSRKWSGIKNWQNTPPELNVLVGKGPYSSNLYEIPCVKLTQGGASDTDAGGASSVTPNPSFNRPKSKDTAQTSRGSFPVYVKKQTAKEMEGIMDIRTESGGVSKAYQEFVDLRNAGKIREGVTWQMWRTATPEKRETEYLKAA